MKTYRYGQRELVIDDLRGVAGLVICGAPLIFLDVLPWVGIALAGFTTVFALFLVRCAIRHRTVVTVTAETIEQAGATKTRLAWREADAAEMKFYSPRRRSGRGWMQLTLAAGGKKVVLDSALGKFDDIVRRAAVAIRQNRLAVSKTTRDNFMALGVDLPAFDGEQDGGGKQQSRGPVQRIDDGELVARDE